MSEKYGIDTLYTQDGEKVSIDKIGVGGGKINIAGNEFNLFPWKTIAHWSAEDKETFEHAINNPTSLFGALITPYCIIAVDNVGDSQAGGGASAIFGYCYGDDKYGAQVLIKFNMSDGFLIRNKLNGTWSSWKKISINAG